MTSSFIGKAGVEAAKKGVTMAGQKLSEFFAKEGVKKVGQQVAQQAGQVFSKEGMKQAGQQVAQQAGQVFSKEGMKQAGQQVAQQASNIGRQAGNVGKALYQNRAELASALGDDLTAVGKGIMKAPETIKGGAKVVGDVTSKAAGKVGEAAVGMGAKVGGEAGAQGVRNVGKMVSSPYAVATGIGVAAEQVVPRLMGGRPSSSLGESVLRQGVSQGIGMPVTAGLAAGGVKPMIATFAGQVAGQTAGQAATDAFLPGKQTYPVDFGEGPTTPTGATKHTMEPEYNEVVRPSTRDLSNVQAQEALSERDKYEYRLKMAQIEKMPSTVMHMSPDSNNQTLASLAQSMMRQASY